MVIRKQTQGNIQQALQGTLEGETCPTEVILYNRKRLTQDQATHEKHDMIPSKE